MMKARLILVATILALAPGCATTSRTTSSEFRIVADQGLLHAPDAAQMTLIPVASRASRRTSRISADGVSFTVDPSRSIAGRPLAGVWAFQVPANPREVATQCYVAFDGSNAIPLRAGPAGIPESYAVSLSATLPLQAAQFDVAELDRTRADIQRRIERTRSEASQARAALLSDPAFVNGQCTQPNAELPPRPPNALSTTQARVLAQRDSVQCQVERFGCDIGSDQLVRALGLPPLAGLPAGYACGQLRQSGVCPSDELTILADFLQGYIFSCLRDRNEENDFGCAVAYAGTLGVRYSRDYERLFERYSRPTRSWQDQVNRLNSAAARSYNLCLSNHDAVESEPETIAHLESQLRGNSNAMEIATQIANENRPFVWQGQSTACSRLFCQGPPGRQLCTLRQ